VTVQETKERPALTLAAKVDYLARPATYDPAPAQVDIRETHMSWVFLAGEAVYKLKKPVRFPYLDFSTPGRREAACRAELRLNRRLAHDVYLDVVPLTESDGRLFLGGKGAPVDWLVKMKRLDERMMLDHLIERGALNIGQLERLAETLNRFYCAATAVSLSADAHLADWWRSLAYNRRVLLDPRLNMPAGLVRRIDSSQRHFLQRRGGLIAARLRSRHIVDGHGDLRPEHIWLDDRVRIIDCIEFNPRLRVVDPFDEIAFLSLECERLGAAWAGTWLERRMKRSLRNGPADALFTFYRCHRATLRARLAVAHLLEASPRVPQKWPGLARKYLALADSSARRLDIMLRTP